ncbi:Pectate lyase plyB [Colletotrichum tanaceti]|uniref:pectate lyase n=1 Tax=Colletotrichum tanaceti TaxID=1306861 RepID=A0A4U6XHR6_9PEZI|nr:Pectate lyase plyB [Colletotrichum tanaceti]TKW55365.1 Pectate lyase plyB [Colletotrichum tanaceti]
MKFSNMLSLALVGFVSAAPTPTVDDGSATGVLAKRASITESCDIGYASTNGGTTGGKGGPTTTVSSLAQFTKAAESSGKLNIVVKGSISGGAKVRVASDKTIVGQKGSRIVGAGLYVKGVRNVILRNLALSKVRDANGDAIGIEASTNVWVDHCDVSSDLGSGKDYYDGLIDITKGADFVTVSNTYLHDHWKTSLVGHVDTQTGDKGKLRVTYANNYWNNVNSRNPSVRFGTVHIYNNFYNKVGSTGVNTRMGAQVRIESSVFENSSKKVILSADSKETGYATVSDMSYGGGENSAPLGNFGSSKVPYSYSLYGKSNVKGKVVGTAGQTLSF